MNPNDNKNSFLDRGTIVAMVLVMFLWVAWSKYMERYRQPTPVAPAASVASPAPAPAASVQPEATKESAPSPAVFIEEKVFDFESESLSFKLSSKGMGIRDINVKNYKTRSEGPIILGQVNANLPFSTSLLEAGGNSAGPLDFAVERLAPDTFVGRASVGGMQIEKVMKILADDYAISTEIKLVGDLKEFKGLVTTLSETIKKQPATGGFLMGAQPEYQEWFVRHDKENQRQHVIEKEATQLTASSASIVAISEHYFTIGVFDKSEIFPSFEARSAAGAASTVGRLVYQPVSKPDQLSIKYVGYTGPKAFEQLAKVDESFTQVIDYGMFGFLGKPILWLLKALQTGLGNWGLSIIFLTIIVRVLVLPFNAYSFKSMKAMQKIQPDMNRIREKYKDQPSEAKLQMNQEIMQLMKQNNASPLGGCLPMLLQLPVFFALYQVLGQSVELYRAPFGLWIHDLSDKDPYFVLPILMGITMYIQQKITPTTMDPQQAKILQWMPVIFSFFMLGLPSGLTLYIFVSTLFGIVQQYYFMRDKPSVGSVKEAKA